MKRYLVISTLILSACSTTATQLEGSKSAATESRDFSANYQEIYRRVNEGAKNCMEASSASTKFDVDAQLYSELGYGEINAAIVSIYGRDNYFRAKIERDGSGSKMTVYADNGLGKARALRNAFSWANGGGGC